MIPINIVKDNYMIKNIKIEDLKDALNCINQSEDNYKTLGRDEYLSYDDIMERYLESLTNSLEFFCGIFLDNKLIGVLKGRIENNKQNEVWYMSLVILKQHRRKGIGTYILNTLEDFFIVNYNIKKFFALVMDDNLTGKSFWSKNGYKILRTIKGIVLKEKDLVIYKKEV